MKRERRTKEKNGRRSTWNELIKSGKKEIKVYYVIRDIDVFFFVYGFGSFKTCTKVF